MNEVRDVTAQQRRVEEIQDRLEKWIKYRARMASSITAADQHISRLKTELHDQEVLLLELEEEQLGIPRPTYRG